MDNILIIKSNFLYSLNKDNLLEKQNSYIIVEDGLILGIYDELPNEYKSNTVIDYSDKVIIPAFSDLHVHAPQYPQRGLAMDELLYNWLNKYTFVTEEKYKDLDYAKKVYDAFVNDLIDNGTLHAVIFSTIHENSSDYLIDLLEKKHIQSYVGKVNMDKGSPSYLCEDTFESIKSTISFINKHKDNLYSKPILTPRFAPTCSKELIKGLGEIAKQTNIPCQTHVVESLWEKQEAINCFYELSCDSEIYEKNNLIQNKPFIAAHFIFPSEKDITILQKYEGFAVHCPEATINVMAGIMPLGKLLDRGINIGLGSDVAAGPSVAIYKQIARAIQLSKIKSFYEEDNRTVTFDEAFYLATLSGGKVFDKVGTFLPGYKFDALVIDDLSDEFAKLSPRENIERFSYSGTKNNIFKKYLEGKEI